MKQDDIFSSLGRLYTEQRELAAIWLNTPLTTGEGRTVRIAPDATVCLQDGELTDVTPQRAATHKVVACFGTLTSQFEMTMIDLKTNEPVYIKL